MTNWALLNEVSEYRGKVVIKRHDFLDATLPLGREYRQSLVEAALAVERYLYGIRRKRHTFDFWPGSKLRTELPGARPLNSQAVRACGQAFAQFADLAIRE